ncbi:winged helix-turn-helix domain-containing protein [Hyphobacterium marinum]|uniref:Transcriptional regulator n=1 Tax=Hyphobacterium marinum TaxID=3116574 RepID=A0ABU7LWZ6_9PROT|nr:transcriptional regulator [Hyphobacterium sp. Y6023]MEE2566093.1 transcriptional regulator [Hyphobacterium sp. Y6023]
MPTQGIGKLDEIIHGRLRLGVMTYLSNTEVADFSELAKALDATRGNLSVQLRKLEDAGYIQIEKSFVDRKSLTQARITKTGKIAFANYVKAIGDLLGNQ